MNRTQFEATLANAEPPPGLTPLQLALWHDRRGNWAEAHTLIQDLPGPAAAQMHAYLHRKEGDVFNADYWYGKAGTARPATDLETEWAHLLRANGIDG